MKTFIIRLTVDTSAIPGPPIYRYAQNPSATWDRSAYVCRKEEAKRFKSVAAAERWLVRQGLAERGTNLMVGTIFSKWEIAAPAKFV